MKPIYKRILLKISGQALAGNSTAILQKEAIYHIVQEILSVKDLGVEVAIVVGGGNVFRGNIAENWGVERAEADNVGMLGTIINGVMLRGAFKNHCNYDIRVMSAIRIPEFAEPYIRLRADHHLSKGSIVILTGGIGQPFVTTDYPAVQRAIELDCNAIFAVKNGVDGVYNKDPSVHSDASLYDTLSFDDAISGSLRFMDLTALVLAREHDIRIHAFNFDKKDCIRKICEGEQLGTLVSNEVSSRFYGSNL